MPPDSCCIRWCEALVYASLPDRFRRTIRIGFLLFPSVFPDPSFSASGLYPCCDPLEQCHFRRRARPFCFQAGISGHGSALLPLWGALPHGRSLAMLCAPLSDHRRSEIQSECSFFASACFIHAVGNPAAELSFADSGGGGVRSVLVYLPGLFPLTSFFFALPFFILIPLLYRGYQWIRVYAGQASERHFGSTCTRSP